jgi:UDP-2,4-diacetamido-2,4,6-trideoxy-beta-L-altropyranose hydrolase
MPPLALFRADASALIGGGHVQRCLALAEWLADAGWRCAFAFRAPSLETVPALARFSHILLPLHGPADEEASELERHCGSACDILIVDHYERARDYEMQCRAFTKRILAFEDLPTRTHDCDYLLDATPTRRPTEYAGLVPPSCMQLLGSQYAILHPRFAAARPVALARHKSTTSAGRVLVSIGMTDPNNMTGLVLDGIEKSGLPLAIDVVLGSAAPHLASVRNRVQTLGSARLHVDATDMAELMSAADIAIGGAGTSSFERCCLALPTLLILAADNQHDIAKSLVGAGAAAMIATAGPLTSSQVAEALTRLCGDATARAKMSKAAVQLCDGRGALRVLAVLAGSVPASDGCEVDLRLAEASDRDILLEWQQHPLSRRFAHKPQAPTAVEHERWFEQTIADPARVLLIVMQDGQPAGMLRLDRVEAGIRKISILTAPGHYRRGIGSAALQLARRFIPAGDLHAEVLPGNVASHALFRRAGYRERAPGLYVNASEPAAFGSRA